VIAIVLAVLVIALLWLIGGHDLAMPELVLRAARTVAIVLIFRFFMLGNLLHLRQLENGQGRLNLWRSKRPTKRAH
jgi:hypothetical protein